MKKVISYKFLPTSPWAYLWRAMTVWLVLDRFQAPAWLMYAIGGFFFAAVMGAWLIASQELPSVPRWEE